MNVVFVKIDFVVIQNIPTYWGLEFYAIMFILFSIPNEMFKIFKIILFYELNKFYIDTLL